MGRPNTVLNVVSNGSEPYLFVMLRIILFFLFFILSFS